MKYLLVFLLSMPAQAGEAFIIWDTGGGVRCAEYLSAKADTVGQSVRLTIRCKGQAPKLAKAMEEWIAAERPNIPPYVLKELKAAKEAEK